MAQRITTTLLDDIDGSEATKTLTFSFDGKSYQIDLNDKNADKFEKALEPFISAGRRVAAGGAGAARSRRRATSGDGPSAIELRDWAKANGLQVSERGRISQEVRDAYDKAH